MKILDNWQKSHTWQVVLFFLAGGLIGASDSPAFAAYKPLLVAFAGFLSSGAVGVGLLSSSASKAVNEVAVTEAAVQEVQKISKSVRVPPLPMFVLLVGVVAMTPLFSCNTPIVAPSEQLGECILEVSLSDIVDAISDPLALIPLVYAACKSYGEATASIIWTYLENYLGITPAIPVLEGGAPLALDASAPLASTSNVSSFLSAVQRARLLRVHDAARATITATLGDSGK
jgi:hypothetical protein